MSSKAAFGASFRSFSGSLHKKIYGPEIRNIGEENMRFLMVMALAAGTALAQQPGNMPSSNSSNQSNNSKSAVQLSSRGEVSENPGEGRIVREVRHELLMLPYLSIFDDLTYTVNGNTVTLMGQVRNSTLKSDAENAIKHIEGVEQVNNQIQVLPASFNDDDLRARMARAIYRTDGLSKYGWSALPSIHIIVNNGHVTLKGVVDNEGDKTLAGVTANGVPGAFSVDNQLQVAK
jgi:hyperosmotically inducible protein